MWTLSSADAAPLPLPLPLPPPLPPQRCEKQRDEARALLVDDMAALTSALIDLKDGAPALQIAVNDAEIALADAEDLLQDKLHAAREAQAALSDALTRFSEFFNGDWNATLTRCAGQDTTDPCRAELASANAKRNALSAIASDASAAVMAAEAAVQEAEDGAAERVLSAAYDAQAQRIRELQTAVNIATSSESSAFAAYLTAVKACPPTGDDDRPLIEVHGDLIQVQLALLGAALTAAPDPEPDAQPLSSDWRDDAKALNLSASGWPRSCPVRQQWAWKKFNSTIDSAEAALSSLRSTVDRLQTYVDAKKQAVKDARKARRQALAERRTAKAALQGANAALAASQHRYDAAVQAKAAVELACRGDATTPVCASRIQNATLAYNRASTDTTGKSLVVLAAEARLTTAETALAQATSALQAARAALAASFKRQQTRLQELQDAITAAMATQRAASLRYRKVLRACRHLVFENTDGVVDAEWHDVDVAAAVQASSDASDTHAKRLMELLLQYAGGTAAPQPLILAAGPAQSGANDAYLEHAASAADLCRQAGAGWIDASISFVVTGAGVADANGLYVPSFLASYSPTVFQKPGTDLYLFQTSIEQFTDTGHWFLARIYSLADDETNGLYSLSAERNHHLDLYEAPAGSPASRFRTPITDSWETVTGVAPAPQIVQCCPSWSYACS